MLAGGVLLLAHTHAISNVKDAQLIELSHLPLAVLAGSRWLRPLDRVAGSGRSWPVSRRWLWPACLVLIGLLLIALP